MASLDYNKLIKAIKDNLTPDLLLIYYKRGEHDHPLKGHCYVASEAFYHSIPNKKEWIPVYASYETTEGHGTHWWLQHKETGKIVDITAKQFDLDFRRILYHKGRRSGFLTRNPSKRAELLLKRINEKQ